MVINSDDNFVLLFYWKSNQLAPACHNDVQPSALLPFQIHNAEVSVYETFAICNPPPVQIPFIYGCKKLSGVEELKVTSYYIHFRTLPFHILT